MSILTYGLALRQTIRLAAAVLAHLVGVGALAFSLSLPDVRPLEERFPATTAFMRLRAGEAAAPPIRYAPVPLERIDSTLVRAVWVSEDATFYQHRGVDWYELRQALSDAWRGGGAVRGASTLTQQLARNLYLSPDRSFGRKLAELFIARRLERDLTKRRILELHLNVAEWGPGVFGAEAAARHYYGVSAATLTPRQAAELAATLPHPLTANPATDSDRLEWRAALILERLRARGWLASRGLPPLDTLALLDSLTLQDTLALRDTLVLRDTLLLPPHGVARDTLAPPDSAISPDTAAPPDSAIPKDTAAPTDSTPPDTTAI